MCWLCEDIFKLDGKLKVTDQCHLAGKHLGAVYQSCKLNVKKTQSWFALVDFYALSIHDFQIYK